MNNYLLKTHATMKEYNSNKYWISSDIVPAITVEAVNTDDALEKYATIVNNDYYVTISRTALKTKAPMFIDAKSGAKQTGFVLTASCIFSDYQDRIKPDTKQFIDLWVDITKTADAFE